MTFAASLFLGRFASWIDFIQKLSCHREHKKRGKMLKIDEGFPVTKKYPLVFSTVQEFYRYLSH
jgi:hypothetical protein